MEFFLYIKSINVLFQEIHLDQWHTNPLFSSTTKKWKMIVHYVIPNIYCTVHWIVYEMHLRRTYSNSFKKKLLPSKVILPPRATLSTPKRKVSVQYSLETLFWLFIFKLYPFRYCEKNGTESDVKDINMNETSLGGGRQDEKSEWKRLLEEVTIKIQYHL